MELVTDKTWKKLVEKSDKPVLVDFYADWCGPCRALGPVLEELAKERTDVVFLKCDTDADADICAADVSSLPTVRLYVGGELKAEFDGARPKAAVVKWLDRELKKAAAE